jgi:hypothetical protein
MLKLDASELEPILPFLFCCLLQGKFFKLHSEFMPDTEGDQAHHFAIGIDAEITHVYHDLNQHPAASAVSTKEAIYRHRRWNKEQTAFFFSDLSHREHVFTLIDLEEKCTKLPSKRFAKVTEKSSHWQWITNLAVKVDQIFHSVHKGRLRWYHEDFFNSLENRGFNFRYDFSRSPHSQTIWHLLTFIAFALSSLMQFSLLGHLSRRGCAIINWIKAIFGELCYLSPDRLFMSPLPKQVRFWNDSS